MSDIQVDVQPDFIFPKEEILSSIGELSTGLSKSIDIKVISSRSQKVLNLLENSGQASVNGKGLEISFNSIQFVKELVVHFSEDKISKIRVSFKKNPNAKSALCKGEFIQKEGQTRVEIDTFCSSLNVASDKLLGFVSVDIKQIEIFVKTEEDLEEAKADLSKAEKIKQTLHEKTTAAHEFIEKEKLKLGEARAALESSKSAFKEEEKRHHDELEKISSEIKNANSVRESSLAENSKLAEQLVDLKSKVASEESRFNEFQAKIEGAEGSLSKLISEITEKTSEKENLKKEVSIQNYEISKLLKRKDVLNLTLQGILKEGLLQAGLVLGLVSGLVWGVKGIADFLIKEANNVVFWDVTKHPIPELISYVTIMGTLTYFFFKLLNTYREAILVPLVKRFFGILDIRQRAQFSLWQIQEVVNQVGVREGLEKKEIVELQSKMVLDRMERIYLESVQQSNAETNGMGKTDKLVLQLLALAKKAPEALGGKELRDVTEEKSSISKNKG